MQIEQIKEIIWKAKFIDFSTDFYESLNKVTNYEEISTLLKECKQLKRLRYIHYFKKDKALENISDLTQLVELDLSHNCLTKLPDGFKNLKNLKKLNLRDNSFRIIPEVISNFEDLEEIDLCVNNFTCFTPNPLSDLKKLISLRLGDNDFMTSEDDFRGICSIQSLQELYLSYINPLKLSPYLHNLKNLKFIKFPGHYLFSDKLGKETITQILESLTVLPSLEIIKTSVPFVPESIIRLKNLKSLGIDITSEIDFNTSISILKQLPSLESLTIVSRLGYVPKSIFELKKIRSINIIRINELDANEVIELIKNFAYIEEFYLDIKKKSDLYLFKEIKNLKKLKKIIIRDVYENIEYSEVFTELSFIPELEEIVIDSNHKLNLKPGLKIIKRLKKIKILHGAIDILGLKEFFKYISEINCFEELDLSDLFIKSIPDEIRLLKGLKKLNLKNNYLLFEQEKIQHLLPDTIIEF